MCSLEDVIREPTKELRLAFVLHIKPSDKQSVNAIFTSRKLVFPRHVIDGARREHFHFRVPCEVLGDVACMKLGAAVDGLAVALDHDRELHFESGSFPAELWGWGSL